MDLTQLIHQYGYFAVAIGAFLEGETAVLLGSVFAQLGHLELPAVMGVAAAAAFLGDSAVFFTGRLYGPRLMRRFPALARAVPRVDACVGRWHALAVVALRFAYGLRTAGPIVLGAGRMRTSVFLCANAVAALLWAFVFGTVGYAFGHAARRLLGGARVEHVALGVVAAVAVAVSIRAARRRLAPATCARQDGPIGPLDRGDPK